MQTVENGAEILASIAGALGVTDADAKSDMAKLKKVHETLKNFPRYEAFSANGKKVDQEIYNAFIASHKAMQALEKYQKNDLPKIKNAVKNSRA